MNKEILKEKAALLDVDGYEKMTKSQLQSAISEIEAQSTEDAKSQEDAEDQEDTEDAEGQEDVGDAEEFEDTEEAEDTKDVGTVVVANIEDLLAKPFNELGKHEQLLVMQASMKGRGISELALVTRTINEEKKDIVEKIDAEKEILFQAIKADIDKYAKDNIKSWFQAYAQDRKSFNLGSGYYVPFDSTKSIKTVLSLTMSLVDKPKNQ